jgi:hypothetical protein
VYLPTGAEFIRRACRKTTVKCLGFDREGVPPSQEVPASPDRPTNVRDWAYPVVYLKLVEAGQGDVGGKFAPKCCGHGAGCDVHVFGWKPSGVILDLDGVYLVYLLEQRRYRCRTHNRVFTVTDSVF